MYEVLQSYGDIYEVVIPSKRDIRGIRYGFIRFFEVRDVENFYVKLDNIFIERRRIFVNFPRFQRNYPRKVNNGGRMKQEQVRPIKKDPNQFATDFYAEKVKSNVGHVALEAKRSFKFDVKERELSRFRKTFVGFVVNLGATYKMLENFNKEGCFSIQVTSLGANISLLEDKVEDELESLAKEGNSWLLQWFREVRHLDSFTR